MATTPKELRLPWGGHFEKEKLPDARAFYERELGALGLSNHKGWAAANCPFHKKSKSHRSFSVHESGAFGCFGCDAKGGDLIDFVRLRDNCDFKSAARSLGAWSDITREGRLQLAEAFAETERRRTAKQQQAEQQEEEAERRERLVLGDELHSAHALYRDLTSRLGELKRGAAHAYEGEEEHIWSLLPDALEDIWLSDRMYCQAAGLEATE